MYVCTCNHLQLENVVKLDFAPPRMPRIPQLSTRGTPTVSVSTHGTREVESVAQGPHTPGSPIGTTSSETELLNVRCLYACIHVLVVPCLGMLQQP